MKLAIINLTKLDLGRLYSDLCSNNFQEKALLIDMDDLNDTGNYFVQLPANQETLSCLLSKNFGGVILFFYESPAELISSLLGKTSDEDILIKLSQWCSEILCGLDMFKQNRGKFWLINISELHGNEEKLYRQLGLSSYQKVEVEIYSNILSSDYLLANLLIGKMRKVYDIYNELSACSIVL